MLFDKDVFAAKLRARRAEMDMTQEELADRSGVAVTGIVNYESGGSGATLDTACKLAEALKCTPNDLIGWNC